MKIRDSADYYEVEKKVKEKVVRGKNSLERKYI